MDRRFVLFLVLSFAILMGYIGVVRQLYPPRPPKLPPDAEAAAEPKPGEDDKPEPKAPPEPDEPPEDQPPPEPDEPPEQPAAQPPKVAGPQPEIREQWVTLGSADPGDGYRMLVTLTNKGAALARVELSSPRYRDLEYRGGYLGHLVMDESLIDEAVRGKGCPVQVVGRGTPAAKAGLQPGDLIVAVGKDKINSAVDLDLALAGRKPNQEIVLTVLRDGKQQKPTPVALTRRPLEVVRPEADDPLSFLLTLHQIDDQKLPPGEEDDEAKGRPAYVERELEGLNLRTAAWKVEQAADPNQVRFSRALTQWSLNVTKTYSLKKVPEKEDNNRDYEAYHLGLDIEIRNTGGKACKVAYQLDGPTGLPTEGWWYARRGRELVTLKETDGGLRYAGIDAQYFAAALMPQKKREEFATWSMLRVGKVDERLKYLTNKSFRLISNVHTVGPGEGNALQRRFEIFVGPKRPSLLAQYGLGNLVDYGWFDWLAVPMVLTLHFFHDYVVFNYGLAILMLTVLVRGCMFPLSRKQAIGAQKMQELQPELKKLQEKYKKDLEARTKAQQELFRKHNYNPLSGCLVLFLQLPIFIALYRALMIDIELRQAPLIPGFDGWCSNLAAPDMLFDWTGFMPQLIVGWLGPYFNILPVLTVVLFVWQQKMFMPPPTDEQQAMQRKVMNIMMIFIGFLFFKVASGLCVYFIASSLWGLAERKFLPKHSAPTAAKKPESRAQPKPQPKPFFQPEAKPQPKPTPQQLASGSDGAAARRKKKRKKNRGKR